MLVVTVIVVVISLVQLVTIVFVERFGSHNSSGVSSNSKIQLIVLFNYLIHVIIKTLTMFISQKMVLQPYKYSSQNLHMHNLI